MPFIARLNTCLFVHNYSTEGSSGSLCCYIASRHTLSEIGGSYYHSAIADGGGVDIYWKTKGKKIKERER
jgi:hypothetical protein